jgi:hypothetical protein
MLTRANGRIQRDDQGSLIVALMVILVLVTLSIAISVRVIGNQGIVLSRQLASTATAAADAGVADALFRIDQGSIGTGGGTSFCVNANDSKCVASSVPGAPGVSYVATQDPSGNTWTVRSLGTVKGQQGAIQETISRGSLSQSGFFTQTSTVLKGSTKGCCSTYQSATPGSTLNNAGSVPFGTDQSINCSSTQQAGNIHFSYYNTPPGGDSTDCEGGTSQDSTYGYNYPLPLPPIPVHNSGCPVAPGGTLGNPLNTTPMVLPAGTYVCNAPVTINGLLNVSGPVSLYIVGGTAGSEDLQTTGPSYINDMYDYCANKKYSTAPGCPVASLPVPGNLLIFDNGSGYVGNTSGTSNSFWIGGVIYAPDATLWASGCQSVYYGTVTLNTVNCVGGPLLSLNYDTSLGPLYTAWTPSKYTVIDPAMARASIP